MNREIKFKVWDNFDYMSNPFTMKDVQSGSIQFTSDCILRQYTGRKDKNGVEIYDGDIVKHGESIRFIEARSSNFCATRGDKTATILLSFCESPEVIGNIYQNPEMLKG